MPRSHPRTMRNLTMQRRHFQLIAETIRDLPIGPDYKVDFTDIVNAFSHALRSTNSLFNAQRFEDTCNEED